MHFPLYIFLWEEAGSTPRIYECRVINHGSGVSKTTRHMHHPPYNRIQLEEGLHSSIYTKTTGSIRSLARKLPRSLNHLPPNSEMPNPRRIVNQPRDSLLLHLRKHTKELFVKQIPCTGRVEPILYRPESGKKIKSKHLD